MSFGEILDLSAFVFFVNIIWECRVSFQMAASLSLLACLLGRQPE